MTWLLALLFPLLALLPRARALGSVSFTAVEGAGWMCTIRPPHGPMTGPRRGSGVNAWTGSGMSMGRALRDALRVAAENKTMSHEGGRFAPRLGGAEFDPDE